MDVLFNSIDVRDLLSSHDLDDSSPLSAPDLRLVIDRLQVRSLHIKSKVQSYILSHHQDFASLFAQCSDAVSRSEQISGQVSDLLGLISDHSVDVEIRDVVAEIGRKRKEAKEKKELLELVRAIVELSEKLARAKAEMRAGRVIEAAEAMTGLKAALRMRDEAAATTEEREPMVYALLRKEWTECFEEIQEVLVRFMGNAVRFEQKSNAVRVKYRGSINKTDGIELHTVLKAMDVVGILDYGIGKVADLMIKYVVTLAVNSRSPSSFVEETNHDSGHLTDAVLKIVPSSDPEIENVDAGKIYSAIIQAIKFIYNSICFQNGHWMRCFGRLMWPRMSELIISNILSKVIPDDASKLSDFQKVVNLTSEFETKLKEMMFIAPDNKDERLSNFADNVEVHFASRKKVEILAKARNLLLQSNFNLPQDYTGKATKLKNDGNAENSPDGVVDLLFLSERCTVSKAASQLMELVHQTLKDVCLSSTRVALQFYHAVRDALLLYGAVIPVKLERQLDGINQVAGLIHNDCLYLSQEILGLAFEYRSDFPSSIKELAVFIDLAPRFQFMAEEILQRQIQLVIYNLKEAIDGADGFQNTHQLQHYGSAKFSIDQVVFILEKVRMIWEPLLLPLTYKRSMCIVLESVFSRMTKDILLLDDMAAEETLQLQRLIHLMLENQSSLLDSLVAINQTGKSSQEGFTYSIDNLIPSLRKLRRLSDLLDMPLKSITAAWESGELVNCGFTSSEVEDFIRAIFTDSPLRKECLSRIGNSYF
ncbi:centromere/kinetochore protein zw10 homolog [Cornus florida]|uniref:centromere/kinetochore protein zw10 homolog n=1 Tax=Cornus florida TaxID=4283 RepID=UPI00289F92AD|nr:centromere/kinetochore protein zw10 homolog [Cornus florida]